MNSNLLPSIAILLLIVGCRGEEEAASTVPQTAKPVESSDPGHPSDSIESPDSSQPSDPIDSSASSDPSGVIVYSTGEDVEWPSLPPPLMEISFDLPEVPEQILGPFSEDVLPAEE